MDAELKRLHSPDVFNLEDYHPSDPEKFNILIQAMVGPKGGEGEESFNIEVCTPRWLEETYGRDEVIIGRHHLIVREFNYKKVAATIKQFLQHCSGKDWNDVATRVSRLGLWEFEDYVES